MKITKKVKKVKNVDIGKEVEIEKKAKIVNNKLI